MSLHKYGGPNKSIPKRFSLIGKTNVLSTNVLKSDISDIIHICNAFFEPDTLILLWLAVV